MLEAPQLKQIALDIFGKNLPKYELTDVVAVPMTDSDGEAALRITLVLTPETADAMTGTEVLKLLVELKDAFVREGEESFALVEYATPDDLDGNDED